MRVGASLVFSAALIAASGCGDTYRSTITTQTPTPPASQPAKYAVAVANVGSAPGVATLIDFSGDSTLVQPQVATDPIYFALDGSGSTVYSLSGNGSLSSFGISTSVRTNNVVTSTLLPGATPNNVLSTSSYLYVTEPYTDTPGASAVAALSGSPAALKTEVPVATGPVWLVGNSSTQRVFALSQGTNPDSTGACTATGNGTITTIETKNNAISNITPSGVCPVFGLMSSDNRRAFILNKGDGTVTVLDAEANTLDVAHPKLNVGAGPVWADIYNTGNLLVVANQQSNTVSIIDISLCSATATTGTANCDANDPIDSTNFGKTLATIQLPAGSSPSAVSVLQDGTRAYISNQGTGTVSVVSLTNFTLLKTIAVSGHPVSIAATTGTPTGKVYVVSPDSQFCTVISTGGTPIEGLEDDSVVAQVQLVGNGVRVRVTQQ